MNATNAPETVTVDLGGRTVHVPKGGYYDRFRMAADLDEVARDPRVPGIDFFRSLSKTRVDSPIGPTLTPNFYYRISTARLTMLAPSRAIRRRVPDELAPLEVLPGFGLMSVMFFQRASCVAKRSSCAHCGWPAAAQKRWNWPSLPTARWSVPPTRSAPEAPAARADRTSRPASRTDRPPAARRSGRPRWARWAAPAVPRCTPASGL